MNPWEETWRMGLSPAGYGDEDCGVSCGEGVWLVADHDPEHDAGPTKQSTLDRQAAVARLAAAAPELYRALETLLNTPTPDGQLSTSEEWAREADARERAEDAARSALRKARGE